MASEGKRVCVFCEFNRQNLARDFCFKQFFLEREMCLSKLMIAVLLGLGTFCVSVGQEDGATKRADKKAERMKARALDTLSKRQLKKYEAIGLTDEQKESFKSVFEKHVEAFMASKAEVEKVASKEQKATYLKTLKSAKADGLKPIDAKKKAVEAMGLDADKAESFKAAMKETEKTNKMIRSDLEALMTDAQKALLKPQGSKKGGKEKNDAAIE